MISMNQMTTTNCCRLRRVLPLAVASALGCLTAGQALFAQSEPPLPTPSNATEQDQQAQQPASPESPPATKGAQTRTSRKPAVSGQVPRDPSGRLGDQQITRHVHSELSHDAGVSAENVTVTTRNGVVTLSGTVDNLLAEERAIKLAEAVKGVQVVVDELDVQPSPPRTDQQILQDVKTALSTDPAARGYGVQAAVEDGTVVLKGTVSSWSERNLAETVVKGVQGVQGVANRIEVDHTAQRTDAQIATDIRNRLKWNVHVKSWPSLQVTVNDGKVTVSGTVDSATERSVVRSLAHVAGVREVDVSAVEVRDWTGPAAATARAPEEEELPPIARAVKSALMRDPRVNSQDVDVTVDDNTVILRGTVYNLKSKLAAEQDARNAIGVETVINEIDVRTAGEPQADDIGHAIETAFLWDPYVKSYKIDVTVADGIVTLKGVVNNHFEKAHAGLVAARTVGVTDVNNELHVNWTVPLYVYDPYVDEYDMARFGTYDAAALEPTRTDLEIEEAIKNELFWSPFVPANNITVNVKAGVATLSGTVANWSEKAAAAENAIEGGAASVANNIVVAPR